eukprot:gene2576-biopygen2066
MELIDEMRCARKAFATSFDSSLDHRFVVTILSFGTQFSYTEERTPMASSLPPIRTRSGFSRSLIAVPSARNSGLLRMLKFT